MAEDSIRRIAGLYTSDDGARGLPPDGRVGVRQRCAKPVLDDLKTLRTRVPGRIADQKITRLGDPVPWRFAATEA